MSIFLGQSLAVKMEDELIPVIFLGKGTGINEYVCVDEDAEEIIVNDVEDFELVREKDSLSPTGKKIYYGSLKKDVLICDLKIKCPDKAALAKEFKELKKHM